MLSHHILQELIKAEFPITIRGFAFVKSCVEMYKQNT